MDLRAYCYPAGAAAWRVGQDGAGGLHSRLEVPPPLSTSVPALFRLPGDPQHTSQYSTAYSCPSGAVSSPAPSTPPSEASSPGVWAAILVHPQQYTQML